MITAAVLAEIHAAADEFSDVLNRQNAIFPHRSPEQMIDRFMAEQMHTLSERVAIRAQGIQTSKEAWSATELKNQSANIAISVNRNTFRLLRNVEMTALVGTLVGLPYIYGLIPDLQGTNLPTLFGMTTGIGLQFLLMKLNYIPGLAKHIVRKRLEALRIAVQDSFYARLAENGIDVPKKDRENWLISKLDGNTTPAWENLSLKQKKELAENYRNFISQLAEVTAINQPEVAAQIRDVAQKISEKQAEVRFWRSSSIRALSRSIGEAVKTIVELDRSTPFLRDAATTETLGLKNRIMHDFPQVFSAHAASFIRESGMDFPPEFQAMGRKLSELGGVILLEAQPRSGNKYDYRFQITFPADVSAEVVTFSISLTDNQANRTSEGRMRLLPNLESLEFNRQFHSQMTHSHFESTIEALHAKRFPKEACAHALNSADSGVREAVTAALELP